MRFVTDEVIPYAEHHYPASRAREQRITAGYSNGGSWALAAAEMRPDLFGNVLAMSAGTSGVAERAGLLKDARIFAGAGLFERSFLRRTSAVVEAARAAGADAEMHILVSGHSALMWDILFADGIAHLLPPRGADAPARH
jgi:enterochelin esterase-like enzyme